jgi:sensor c-di-GMP phosphodiesterase-like protein
LVRLWSRHGRYLLGVVGLVLVCVPIVGARIVLSAHTRDQANYEVRQVAEQFVARTDDAIDSTAGVLSELTLQGAATCAPQYLERLARAAFGNFWIKEIVVRGADGQPLCNQFGDAMPVTALSPELATKRAGVLLQAVNVRASGRKSLMIVFSGQPFGGVSAVISGEALGAGLLPMHLVAHASGSFALGDGSPIALLHAARPAAGSPEGYNVTATATSQTYPFTVTIGAPLSAYSALADSVSTFVTIGGGFVSTLIFGLFVYLLRGPPVELAELKGALQRGEFLPYYQPIINIATGRMAGCEALIRWRKSNGTIVTPDAFIRLAETTRLAWPMTIALMERVRRDLDETFGARSGLKISINLFNAHFSTLRTVRDVEGIFGGSRIAASQLVFELTERMPLGDFRRARAIIRRLQSIGARVALDDAGTGHSGLAAMHQLGVDVVKIDKLFVDTIMHGTATPIIDALIKLGHDLQTEVVAEGVETFEQLDYLRTHGADSAQGYLFAAPMPARAFIDLVEAMEPIRVAERAAGRGTAPAIAAQVA